MRVQVEEGLWHGVEVDAFRQLRRLMVRAAEGQHTVEVLGDPQSVVTSRFFETMVAPAEKVEWEEILNRTLAAPAHMPERPTGARVKSGVAYQRELTKGFLLPPAVLGDWAEESLMVLLENDTDWLLIRWAALVASEQGSTRLAEAIDEGWIAKNGRGGTGELHKSTKDSPQMRCVVVVDSDRDEFKDPPSTKSLTILKDAHGEGLPVHILGGRELENYVPESYWWRFVPLGSKRQPAEQAREVHLWSRLLTMLMRDESALRSKHGEKAFETVVAQIKKSSSRKISPSSRRALLEERKSMTPEERAVDDIKARLGRAVAKGVAEAEKSIDALSKAEFDTVIRGDLKRLAELLTEWL